MTLRAFFIYGGGIDFLLLLVVNSGLELDWLAAVGSQDCVALA